MTILDSRTVERIPFAGLLKRVHVDDREGTECRVPLAVERCESDEDQSQRNLLAIARGDRGLLMGNGEATAVESVLSLLNESFAKKTIAIQNLASGK